MKKNWIIFSVNCWVKETQIIQLFILGDINIDYLQGKNSNKSHLKELEVKYDMRQMTNTPTRNTIDSRSIIDLIFTTVPVELIISCSVLKVQISNHLPVFINRKKKKVHHPKRRIQIRIVKDYNKDDFACIILDDPRWHKFWHHHIHVDDLWNLIITIIIDSLNILCPIKYITICDDQLVLQ